VGAHDDGRAAATARLLDLICAGWTTQVIGVAADLGLADALAAEPLSADALAQRLKVDADALMRLLRALVSLEVCVVDAAGRYGLTAMGALLQAAAPGSLQSWAVWWSRYLWPVWGDLKQTIATGQSARLRATGASGFAHVEADPAAARVFNAAMGELTALVAEALVREIAFPPGALLADLGGGSGQLLVGVLRAHPSLRGLLVELPHVLADARKRLQQAGMADRVQVRAADFFDAVPTGADVYVIKSVLHNWDDARCTLLLQNCRAAMQSGARLLVVERVQPERLRASADDQALARNDLNMLVGLGGRERTAAQLALLFEAAGLLQLRSLPLALGLHAIELGRAP
jgi:hypothetical protein